MELCKYPKMGNVRTFHIEAIQIPIVYNQYGDYDPDGLLYVLEEDAKRIKQEALKKFEMDIPQPYKKVRPLVIRANLGDTVKVRFHNSLDRRLSIHVQGLSYDVNTSDGSSVGYNNDSTTSGEIWYTWYADTEGVYLFNDMADPRSTEDATNIHGLFGAIIVEAPEAQWFDPETGEELESGLMANIYQPGKPAFREYTVFFHDELEVLNKEGKRPIDPHTELPSSTTVGNPVKIRLIHGGVKETHVFHLHNHQFRLESDNLVLTILDSITISPQECYTLDILDVTNKPTPLEIAKNVKVFEIAMVQAKITYNSYGWHDPQGRFFVLKEELERHGGLECYINKIEKQEIKAEPLVIRANAGDCIELRTTNLLPEFIKDGQFQPITRTDIVGNHLHLVKSDTIVSDGSANGWNNIADARQYETLVERFFVNEKLGTVFFHEHLFANIHQQHGLFGALIIEETGATFHNPQDGKELHSGTQAVIRRKDGTSFREFALFVHDFAFLFDRQGKPLNSPEVSGLHNDLGVMGINYRAEPMRERLRKKEDPAYIFSSFVHGDPATPVFETYSGDELMFRLIDGTHKEQPYFNITGMSWKKELEDNLNVTQKYSAGDYLYYFGEIADAWLGLWGIIRVYEEYKKHLKPLCKEEDMIYPHPPCPSKKDVVRRYEVVAIQKKLVYNRYGDHDPDGLIFVPLEDVDNVLAGKCMPKPLILRANVGDWIEVTLHNAWNPKHPIPYFSYPRIPLDEEHTPSMRVSLNPQFLRYNPVFDSGINVGYNEMEQTVEPGESKRYLWYADQEYGACLIQSFGDMRNHCYHGLFGAIIIEPPGAEWYRNFTKKKDSFAEQAVITAPGVENFREYVLFIQNGIRLLDAKGNLIQTAAEGYNYSSERFANRLAKDSRTWKVFSSKVHGDPATPVLKAYPGDRVISRIIPMQGGVSIGNKFDIELQNSAKRPGDYLYRSGSFAWDVESGMWGIFRVTKQTFGCKCKGIYRKIIGER